MKDNGSNARVTEEVMAKDKKKPVQQDEKMPAEHTKPLNRIPQKTERKIQRTTAV